MLARGSVRQILFFVISIQGTLCVYIDRGKPLGKKCVRVRDAMLVCAKNALARAKVRQSAHVCKSDPSHSVKIR